MIEFTPLRRGTIRDIFSQKRNTPMRKGYDLRLPEISTQCVHVEIEELTEGDNVVRCVEDAVTGRHGWLCQTHGADRYVPRRQEHRNKDQEIVDGIIAYEQRALRLARRVTVRVGAKIQLEYLG